MAPITFFIRKETYSFPQLSDCLLLQADDVKYVWVTPPQTSHMAQRIATERNQLRTELNKIFWFFGQKSQLIPQSNILLSMDILGLFELRFNREFKHRYNSVFSVQDKSTKNHCGRTMVHINTVRQRGIPAVSYTHLDVYKRQCLHIAGPAIACYWKL